MESLYRLGSINMFRNLRFIVIMFGVILGIALILKIKKTIDNYNYINRDISVLESLENLSKEEFLEWVYEYLESKEYKIVDVLDDESVILNSNGIKTLGYITRDYNILDKVDAKKIYGFSIYENCKDIILVTTGNIDKSFSEFTYNNGLNIIYFTKKDFEKGYKEFVIQESNSI